MCLTPPPPPSSSSCPRLQILRLSHNALCGQTSYGYGPRNEDGLKSVLASLENSAELQVCDLSHCGLGETGLGHAARVVEGAATGLHTLQLSGNRFPMFAPEPTNPKHRRANTAALKKPGVETWAARDIQAAMRRAIRLERLPRQLECSWEQSRSRGTQ